MSTTQFDQPPNQHFSAALSPSCFARHDSSHPDAHGTRQVAFLDSSDEAFARALDECGVAWRYKPRTFAVEWDDEGNFVDSFTPAFYLPADDRYVALKSTDRASAALDARSVRLLRQNNPTVRIDFIDPPSLERFPD
jgi:phosphatidate phosphatase APP1